MANNTPLKERTHRLGVDALGLVARMNHCLGICLSVMPAPNPHVVNMAAELRAEADDLIRQLTGEITHGPDLHQAERDIPAQTHAPGQ